VALGVPCRLRPQIISTFGTTRVVGHQPYAPAAFTPGEIPGTYFQRLSQPQGTWFCRKEPRLVAQRLNHYATPGPWIGLIGCPETSRINYHYSLHNPEERSFHLFHSGSLKSCLFEYLCRWMWGLKFSGLVY